MLRGLVVPLERLARAMRRGRNAENLACWRFPLRGWTTLVADRAHHRADRDRDLGSAFAPDIEGDQEPAATGLGGDVSAHLLGPTFLFGVGQFIGETALREPEDAATGGGNSKPSSLPSVRRNEAIPRYTALNAHSYQQSVLEPRARR